MVTPFPAWNAERNMIPNRDIDLFFGIKFFKTLITGILTASIDMQSPSRPVQSIPFLHL